MERPSLQLCVATGQNLPNLIAALQLRAQKVVILETPQMRMAASHLKRALKAHGIAVECKSFDDATPSAIIKSAGNIALELGEQPLVLNATGGHKLMTLALADQMDVVETLHLLYVETRHMRLDWLKPVPEVEPMADVLTIDDVLLTQGFQRISDGSRDVQWQTEAEARADLTRKLGDEANDWENLFGMLNYLADSALNEDRVPFRPQQTLKGRITGPDRGLLNKAQQHGLLTLVGNTEIVFASADAARYFRGGWLEEYVWIKLRGIKPKDWAVNLVIQSLDGTLNEFDGVMAHKNCLTIIECKTTGFGKDAQKDAGYISRIQP